ncbi:hypothetical protein JTB14_026108 [Gonioctena quinquepunctata]|nr:hypothetical protein JTB14_026108 [Gonioctena quinquepunctata]
MVESDPQKHFRLGHPSGNIENIKNNGIISTSTPQVKSSKQPKINISVMKNSNFSCEKKVNIIKSNIRKLLNGKSSEVSPKKVERDISHRRGENTSKVVIHNENITLDDTEVVIFNSPSISTKSGKAAIITSWCLQQKPINFKIM